MGREVTALDFAAREVHFLEHLAPVWHELPVEHRGTFFLGETELAGRAAELDVGPVEISLPTRSPAPLVCASWGDLRLASRARATIAYFEHGAGQTYGGARRRHASYAGGVGRERVRLFLCPNADVAAANRKHYPTIPAVVVGSARVDELRALPRAVPGPFETVAISFHWRCKVAPEADSAIDHYAPALADVAAELDARGVTLIGHGHPRIFDELEPIYRAAGIEPVRSFVEVVRRAEVYAVDNSSTLFEFAALDRPVVVLNAPGYRREVEHGLRFWRDADVGVQVDDPGELADAFVLALDDPPELARSREEALDRVYPVRDGSSARRAASALLGLVGVKRCPICGRAHASCGEPTTVLPVDLPRSSEPMARTTRRRYPNPARPGAFFVFSDEAAKKRGLDPARDSIGAAPTGPAPAIDAATHELDPATPPGALPAGGPTSRARKKAEPAPELVDVDEEAPEVEAEVEEPADPTPKDKARPAPRRRRRASES